MNTPDYFNIRVLQAAFCATSLLLMIPNAQAVDGYAKDASNGCAIFKPNLKAGETVTFKGPCVNIFGEGRGVAKWSASDGTTVTFEGNFVQGKLQGNGKMTASGGDSYEGDYKDGKREGLGVYTSANGDRFNGQYKDNQRNGHGIMTLATGSRTEGEWRNGNPVSVTSRSSSGAGLAGPKLGPPQPSAAAPQTPQAQASSTPPSGTAGRQAPGTSLWPTPSLGSAQTQSASPAASTTTSASGSGGSAKIGQEIRTASGALFRVDDCGFHQAVLVVPPKSLDLRTSSQSGQYSGAAATGGIFPIVREAVEFFLSVCKTGQGYVVKPPRSIFLFLDRLPPPGGIVKAITDETQLVKIYWIGGDSWSVWNGPSEFIKKQDALRREQEAVQQKQAQVKAQHGKREAFLKQHGAIFEIPLARILKSNPFSLEGKTIGIAVEFGSMNSPTVGMFQVLQTGGIVVVSDIPKGTFLQPTQAFLAAKVIGLIPVQGLGTVPHLKYVGVVICSNPDSFTPCP